jgi:hypothetical protein
MRAVSRRGDADGVISVISSICVVSGIDGKYNKACAAL